MCIRKASIKETGEELSQEDWARFDAAVASIQAERARRGGEADGQIEPQPETRKDQR